MVNGFFRLFSSVVGRLEGGLDRNISPFGDPGQSSVFLAGGSGRGGMRVRIMGPPEPSLAFTGLVVWPRDSDTIEVLVGGKLA